MKLHANAALSLTQRRRMVLRVIEQGWSIKAAAAAAETSPRTCGKWVARYRAGREIGLLDRSSAPRVVANRTCERRIEAIAALRRLRLTGPQIAELLQMPLSTVSGILKRIGLGRLGRLGLEPAARYQRERPGEPIHIDVKKLGRIQGGAGKRVTGVKRNPRRRRRDASGVDRGVIGWEFLHVAIDDATRLAYAEVLSDEKAVTAWGSSLERGLLPASRHQDHRTRHDRQRLRVRLRAPSPRPSSALAPYISEPSRDTPQTNGKAERLIQTLLRTAGPTARSTATAENAPPPLTAGRYGPTTIAADTPPSAANHPSTG